MKLKVFIPLADGQDIQSSILKSLAAQTVEIDVIPCVCHGILNRDRVTYEQKIQKLYGEILSRNKIIYWINVLNVSDEFVAMQDSDIVHLKNDNYANCIDYLKNNNDHVAVALYGGCEGHLSVQAVVLRTNIVKKLTVRVDDRQHVCCTFEDDLKKYGKYCYLNREKLIMSKTS